jgi:hypothetical protein
MNDSIVIPDGIMWEFGMILILDDNEQRHSRFRDILNGHQVVHTYTYSEFCEALKLEGAWELICLDHDLGECVLPGGRKADAIATTGMYGDSGIRPADGQDAVDALIASGVVPKSILIHSWNDTGSDRMHFALRKHYGDAVHIVQRKFEGA